MYFVCEYSPLRTFRWFGRRLYFIDSFLLCSFHTSPHLFYNWLPIFVIALGKMATFFLKDTHLLFITKIPISFNLKGKLNLFCIIFLLRILSVNTKLHLYEEPELLNRQYNKYSIHTESRNNHNFKILWLLKSWFNWSCLICWLLIQIILIYPFLWPW